MLQRKQPAMNVSDIPEPMDGFDMLEYLGGIPQTANRQSVGNNRRKAKQGSETA